MIKDNINNAEIYYGISDQLKKGFEWIKTNDLTKIENGRYDIDKNIYANVQSYETKDDAPYEAHRKYIDIQYMINGSETIGVTSYNNCTVKEAYNNNQDIEFLDLKGNECMIALMEKEFMVFFPNDAHKPALNHKEKKYVKKVIVKVGL